MAARSERIDYLDVSKGIAMLCVILAHCPVPSLVSRICFSFHMPVFFLISGYLFKKREMNALTLYKTRQLLYPYLFTVLSVIVVSACINWYIGYDIVAIKRTVLEWLWAGFYGSGNNYNDPFWIKQIGAIWFLPAMFFAILLFNYCLEQKCVALWVVAFVLLGEYTKSIIWLPLSIQASFLSLGYIYIGYEIRQKDLLEKTLKRPIAIISGLCLWMFYLICNGGQLYLVGGYWGKGIIYDMFFSTVASLCIIWLSFFISQKVIFIKKICSFYGKHSLIILCAHLVELNTIDWDILIGRLFYEKVSYGIYIFVLFCLKIVWATMAVCMIELINIRRRSLKSNGEYTRMIETPNLKSKDGYIECVRGLVFLLTILGHLPIEKNVRTIIFSFHAPLLCMLMGCAFRRQLVWPERFKEICRLLFTYIGFRFIFLIGILWKNVFYYEGGEMGKIIREWTIATIFGMSSSSSILTNIFGVGYIWIIICLLFVFILGTVIFEIKNEMYRCSVVIATSILGMYIGKKIAYLPFSFDIAMVCIAFLYAGYIFELYGFKEKVDCFRILLPTTVLWMTQIKMGGIELAVRNYPCGFFCVIGAIAGCVIVIEMAQYLMKIEEIKRILCFIGRNYLIFWGTYYLTSLCSWDVILDGIPITIRFLDKMIICASISILIMIAKDIFLSKLNFLEGSKNCKKYFGDI